MFIRVVPSSNVDNRRSIRERVGDFFRAIVDIEVSLEFFGLVVTVVAGIGILGYVVAQWALYFFAQNHYIASLLFTTFFLVLACGAIARIPIAMIIFLGSAVICGTAFMSGASSVVLP